MKTKEYITGYQLFLSDMGIDKEANLRNIYHHIRGGGLLAQGRGLISKGKGLLQKVPKPPKAVKPISQRGVIPSPANQMGAAEQSARVFQEAAAKNKGNIYPTTLKGKATIGGGLGLAGLGSYSMLNSEPELQTGWTQPGREGLLSTPEMMQSVNNPLNAYYTYNNGLNGYYGP